MANLFNAAVSISRLEELSMGKSPVHSLHPMAKLLTTAIYVITVISFPSDNISGLIAFVFYPAVLMSLSGTPYSPLLARLAAALPFALMGGISNLFVMRSTAFYIGSFAVSSGLVSFVSILFKTALTVIAVLILIATTSYVEICRQLVYLKTPKILCLQFVLTYRYLSVLISEAYTMYISYTLRAAGQKGVKMGDMGSFLGQLILRSFDRAERVYHAMRCRGFDGVYNESAKRGLNGTDWAFMITVAALILVLRFFNFSYFLGSIIGYAG